ncbi:DUF4214 domain-containing protein [Candidatus Poribacteria bacterium]|nr:DUF4214 domain-containing protein [Candidatus Poribacteria bacterium]
MIPFTHKKYRSLVKKALILFVLCAAVFFFSGISNLSADSSDILICIDPGHGGRDPGAIGPTGLTEKEVNLDIAIRLKNKLRNAGYRVIMTRESDVYKSLQERVVIANDSGASVFVSIHNNAFTLPIPNGTETYYSTNSPSLSRELAIDVHNSTLQQINTYNRGVKTADFYVLKNTTMISALLEGVFISNPTEEAKLRDASFREKIASGVYNGIRDFLSSNDVVSYSASIDDLGNTPSRMMPGEQAEFSVKIKNNSDSFTWHADGENNVRFSYHIYDKYGNAVVSNGSRTNLTSNLEPGGSQTISANIEVPESSGTYTIEYDMVHEGITWFEDRGSKTLKKTIYVVDEECIAEYFINLYEELLLITPEQAVIDEAVNVLADGSKTAGDVISELMAAQEFIDRDLNNGGFVTTLYKAFFDREPDTRGYNYWLGKLNNGSTRQSILNSFASSAEFSSVCNSCGVIPGKIVFDESAQPEDSGNEEGDEEGSGDETDGDEEEDEGDGLGDDEDSGDNGDGDGDTGEDQPGEEEDEEDEEAVPVELFFINLHEELLLITPEQAVIDEAVSALSDGSKSAGDIISELMADQAFIDRDLDNSGFVTTLYKAFFDRDPDTRGYSYWLGKLNAGMKRSVLISYFMKSSEFRNICKDCSIEVGKVIYNDIENNETVVTTITNSTDIMGSSSATKEQLVQLFTNRNSSQVDRAQRLADLYIQWGNTFNIRYDIAWAQMCHETGFLGYTGIVPPDANNFAGIGATGQKDSNGNYVYNTFSNEELGVIAHYMHLAWYAAPDHLNIRDDDGDFYCSNKYDPRHFGTSHNYSGDGSLNCLNTRWAPSSTYTDKIIQFANEIYN